MKKIYGLLLASILLLTACGTNMDTPTASVENYLKKYQDMDNEIITQLDSVISSDNSMSDEQKKSYKDIMLTQYKNLSYKIKDESINGDEAEVEVEIEVLDYATNISEARNYYRNHADEFKNDKENAKEDEKNDDKSDNEEGDVVGGAVGDAIDTADDAMDKVSSFIEYKIKQLSDVDDKTTYTLTFYLTKIDNEWVVNDLSDTDIQKLHGLYEG